ncbi:hypothetical protein PT300_09280 [Enterobacteriaceae bacterium ESL0689]|nr:hypothetical protein [Enterobacteriaceae bacterium ESL0689]
MKLWLSALALVAVTLSAAAENFRIVQSPMQKLDIWIDDIRDNTPESWCQSDVTLRIVAHGKKDLSVLKNFLPRLGSLLEHQCGKLNTLHWTLNNPAGVMLMQGSASQAQGWGPIVQSPESAPVYAATSDPLLPPEQDPESHTVAADRTPWQEFTLQDGCHLRTFWQGGATASALFIPDSGLARCSDGSWLNGHTVISQIRNGVQEELAVTYVHGFPVVGLDSRVDAKNALIASVNNERMVFSTQESGQSWMILPYDNTLNVWKSNGTIAMAISPETARDNAKLQAHITAVKQIWQRWISPETPLNIILIDTLRPQLRDPAVGVWRTAE